jgi:hypothetical protein
MLKIFIIVIIILFIIWAKNYCDNIFSPFLIKENKDCCSLDSALESNANSNLEKVQTEKVQTEKVQTEKVETKTVPPEETKVETVDINSDYIIILSRDGCSFCTQLVEEYSSKTSKKYTIINLKSNLSFSFDNNFLELEPQERENIIKGVQSILSTHPILFPTIVYNKIITKGLIKSKLDNIFF